VFHCLRAKRHLMKLRLIARWIKPAGFANGGKGRPSLYAYWSELQGCEPTKADQGHGSRKIFF